MYNITLICTKHHENGLCNIDELYKIIEKINPEIIFEEMSPSYFDVCYNGQRFSLSLEANAIKKYLQKHCIEHISVDNFDLKNKDIYCLKNDIDYMFDKIEYNNECRNLENEIGLLSGQLGFAYLNSNQCGELFNKKHILEESIVNNSNDDKLFCVHKLWTEINDEREDGMINNIYSYSKEHRFEKGLFLIGAAHRKSMINKIQKHAATENVKLNWNFSNYSNIL